MIKLKCKKIITLFLLWASCFTAAWAASGFIVRQIQVKGLHRVSKSTVLTYLPIKPGQRLESSQTPAIIRALYNTGFFSNVSLLRHNNDLIIKVAERPTIGTLYFSGNKKISTKQLRHALKQTGIQEGLVFNHSSLSELKHALLQQYYNLGRYDAHVTTKVYKEPRNRVGINIKIYEGQVAKIRQIQLIGNHAFSDHTLLKHFKLSTPNLFSWITHNDQYSREKLEGDLEKLRSYYMDRGYLEFQINSTQVSITPNKQHIYITIHVTEGPKFHLSGYKLAGKLLGQRQNLQKRILLKKGQVFSRKQIVNTQTTINHYFANRGYAFAEVKAVPKINKNKHTVFITFNIHPKHIVYINHITFSGNTRTADYVLRREMRLMEGSPFSWKKIDESKRRLRLLGYIGKVQTQMQPVSGSNDKINLHYKVQDKSSTTFNVMGGYSDMFGFLYGASIQDQNFLGTGKGVGISFQRNQYFDNYQINYNNPYYTINGISRGFSLYYNKYTPGKVNLAPYTSKVYGGTLNYGIPLSEKWRANLGLGYEHNRIGLDSNSGQIITDFINQHGHQFNTTKVMAGLSYEGYDRAIFPTKGFAQSISTEVGAPLLNNSLNYYKLHYSASLYQPLLKGFIVHPHANLGYGNGYHKTSKLPFVYNYYAGGINSVRGYDGNTLGPKDPRTGDPVGGNVLTTGSVELIFPNPISKSIRTSMFVDAGNVYQSQLKLNSLRYSAGIDVQWLLPIFGAPLDFSFAKALNAKSGDDTRFFQFSISTGL